MVHTDDAAKTNPNAANRQNEMEPTPMEKSTIIQKDK
jgi:hypothetical protein